MPFDVKAKEGVYFYIQKKCNRNHIHIIFSKFNKLFKVDYADSSQKQTLEFGQKIEL